MSCHADGTARRDWPPSRPLGVDRAKDGQLVALVEIDADHCATCYADGVQMATGCTFGKGNIQKLGLRPSLP